MSFEFKKKIAKMEFEEYITCIRRSLNAPKVFLKRTPKEMRINLFNGKILLAWKANLDIQVVLEPYGCTSYIVGYNMKQLGATFVRGSRTAIPSCNCWRHW